MWDFMLGTILRVFGILWMEDERPAARWFSVGCLAIVLAVIGVVAWIYAG